MENKICLSTKDAHFISLGNGRLSTAVTLYPIPIGNITIGSNESCDIQLKGPGVGEVHCSVTRKDKIDDNNLGDVVLNRIGSGKVLIEGIEILQGDECILQQGSMITIGDSNYLRFNFPRKAEMLRSNGNNSNNNHSAMDSSEKYDEVLRKTLNTSYVNFAEYKSEKTLNNNDNVSEKMKNLKLKTNDSYPSKVNMQVYPFASNSLTFVESNNHQQQQANSNNNNAKVLENVEEMQQLEQVLKMFVDYNNDNRSASNRSLTQLATSPTSTTSSSHQNRIKTNGSLPKNFHAKDHANNFEFYDSSNELRTTDDIEMYKKPQSPRTRIKTFVTSPTKLCLSPTDNNDKSSFRDSKKVSSVVESYERDYEKLIKSFEEKFRLDIYNIQNGEPSSACASNECLDSSYLNSEKHDVLSKIRELKVLISDIQLQESESYLESDVEKSLVLAEMSTEKSNLEKLNEKLSALKKQMKQLEIDRIKKQKQQEIKQIKMKNSIKDVEAEINMIKEQKKLSADTQNRLDELIDKLEVDKKTYEDFEFHFLEDEAEWASLAEEYKENISTFTHQINEKKNLIQQLEQANLANENNTNDEQKTLETRLFNLKQKLENEREKLKSIDKILSSKTEGSNQSLSKTSASDSSSFDRNSNNIMSKSFNENMFFNRNKIEISHIDFNSNVDDDKVFLNSSTPLALSRPSSVVSQSNQLQHVKDQNGTTTATTHQHQLSTNASPLTMPKFNTMMSSTNYFNNNKPSLLPYAKSIANGSTSTSTLPLLRDAVVTRQNNATKQKRPLTRYLPNFSLDFDLKRHIETAGHQIQLCPHVILTATSCRGYLNKVGAKPLFSMRANNRWFVFDREKQMFVYYSDKSEKKPRGGAYFNAITDVYFDHSAASKNNRTFIVKTKSRIYTLQAPSQQACSIWIDVIITGAQGKILEMEK